MVHSFCLVFLPWTSGFFFALLLVSFRTNSVLTSGSLYSSLILNAKVDETLSTPPSSSSVLTAPPTSSTSLKSPPFRTSLPLYFINLDRSQDRRTYMEAVFGPSGSLHRVEAVDARKNLDFALAPLLTSLNMTVEQYLRSVSARPGEVALSLSHFHTCKIALENGDAASVIFEDDVSPLLTSLWGITLDELVETANAEFPDWEIIRLSYGFPAGDIWPAYLAWRADPSRVLATHDGKFLPGTVAQVLSRRGLEAVVERFSTHDDGFDCRRARSKCVIDKIYSYELSKSLIATPPLFSVRLFEGSTGVRVADPGEDDSGVNRHWMNHQQQAVDSLRWAVDAFESRLLRSIHPHVTSVELESLSPATRWGVIQDVNSPFFVLHRMLNYFGVSDYFSSGSWKAPGMKRHVEQALRAANHFDDESDDLNDEVDGLRLEQSL